VQDGREARDGRDSSRPGRTARGPGRPGRAARHRLHPGCGTARPAKVPVPGMGRKQHHLPVHRAGRDDGPARPEHVAGAGGGGGREPVLGAGRLAVRQRAGLGHTERGGDPGDVRRPGKPRLQHGARLGRRRRVRGDQPVHRGAGRFRPGRAVRRARGHPGQDHGRARDRTGDVRDQRARARDDSEAQRVVHPGAARVRGGAGLRRAPARPLGLPARRHGCGTRRGAVGHRRGRVHHHRLVSAVLGHRRRLRPLPAGQHLPAGSGRVDRTRRVRPARSAVSACWPGPWWT
jgi:hypothetical protein